MWLAGTWAAGQNYPSGAGIGASDSAGIPKAVRHSHKVKAGRGQEAPLSLLLLKGWDPLESICPVCEFSPQIRFWCSSKNRLQPGLEPDGTSSHVLQNGRCSKPWLAPVTGEEEMLGGQERGSGQSSLWDSPHLLPMVRKMGSAASKPRQSWTGAQSGNHMFCPPFVGFVVAPVTTHTCPDPHPLTRPPLLMRPLPLACSITP